MSHDTRIIRERLLEAITLALDGVYSLAGSEDERDLPLTVVQDGEDSIETRYDSHHATMPITVLAAEAITATARESMRAQGHQMLQRVIERMHADETFGGLADGVSLLACAVAGQPGKLVTAQAQFEVRYHFDRGQPARRSDQDV